MQQFCNTCGSPIYPGSAVCSNCGTPVGSGSGAYDPTVRAGTPPNTGYGQPPYGGMGNAATPPPPPPPPGGGFGAPPPPPGFVGQPYGQPPQPIMPAAVPPKKSNRWIWYVLGGVAAVLIICCVGGYILIRQGSNAVVNSVNRLGTQVAQTSTALSQNVPGAHISNVHIGTGDKDTGQIQQETTTFQVNQYIVITFTATVDEANPEIKLNVVDSSGTSQGNITIPSTEIRQGTNEYYFAFYMRTAGDYTAQIQYDGTTEQTVDFSVS